MPVDVLSVTSRFDIVNSPPTTTVGRRMRCCQPRDLLTQIRNMCLYEATSLEMTTDAMDFAVENYFAVL